MAYVTGFLPWILYWILIGNVNFRLAVCIVLAAAVIIQVISWRRGQPPRSLDVGSLVVFVLLAVAAFVVDDGVLEMWMQPLSNLGLLLVALGGILLGRPFVRDFAISTVDAETAQSDGFRYITTGMTWMWIVAFALMTVVSAIPPLVSADASLQNELQTISVVCYWVVPYVLLAAAGVISAVFPKWFEKQSALVDQREAAEQPTPVPPATAPADSVDGRLALQLPAESGHDQPLGLLVQGVPAGATVQLSTSGPDLYGSLWRSEATFKTAADGVLDLSAAAPAGGDWSGADPSAPVWAMRFATPDRTPSLFVAPEDPWPVTVEVEVTGVGRARRTVHRRSAEDGVRAEPVSIDDFPGLLMLPAGPVPGGGWPAVACFGGSEGGFASQIANAALLASHGYAALAASFIAEETADKALSSVPLERFLAALRHLSDHDHVDGGRVAAMAISRGAEGLLAAASHAEDLPRDFACRGLILMSPSSVSWQAVGGNGGIPDTPTWTWAGQPVPWAPMPTGALMPQIIRNASKIGRDTAEHRPTLIRLRPAYEAGLHQRGPQQEAARIAAERIRCPLLLLTGGEDALWPSQLMADELLQRRAGRADDQHQHYPAAGHLLRLGNLPTDAQWTSGLLLGGTREGQAEAQSDGTLRVLTFLNETLEKTLPETISSSAEA